MLPNNTNPTDLLTKDEPLRAELKKYLVDLGDHLGIKHPFCVGYCDPAHAALIHQQVDHRQKRLREALAAKEWDAVVWLYERAFRLQGFIEHCHLFDDGPYWRLLAEVWTDQEILWANWKAFLNLFQSPRKDRQHLMEKEERAAFESLPDEIEVFRGVLGRGARSLSWTLDRKLAEWFATRFASVFPGKQPRLASGVVSKADVLGYFTRRKESEVVVDPRSVKKFKVIDLP